MGLFGLVEELDDDGRQVFPPLGCRGLGSVSPGVVAGLGCLHPPAHGLDGAVAFFAVDAAVFRAHPDSRAEKAAAFFRNSFSMRASRSS
ncbi:hypothetical protein, partial [Propionibacterium acidifaciens]